MSRSRVTWRDRARFVVEHEVELLRAMAPWRALVALAAAQAVHDQIERVAAKRRSPWWQAVIDRSIGTEERLVATYRAEIGLEPVHLYATVARNLRRRARRVYPFAHRAGYAYKAWCAEVDRALRAIAPDEHRRRLLRGLQPSQPQLFGGP